MTKVTINANGKSSPKKEFIRDFNVAFAKGNADFIIQHASNDIHWLIYGDKDLRGKEAFTKEINIMKDYTADEVIIHSIITHGSEGAVNGEMVMGDTTYAFCDMYTFQSAASMIIKDMKSYVVKLSK